MNSVFHRANQSATGSSVCHVVLHCIIFFLSKQFIRRFSCGNDTKKSVLMFGHWLILMTCQFHNFLKPKGLWCLSQAEELASCVEQRGGKKKDGNGNNVQCLVDRELERSLEGLQLSSAWGEMKALALRNSAAPRPHQPENFTCSRSGNSSAWTTVAYHRCLPFHVTQVSNFVTSENTEA